MHRGTVKINVKRPTIFLIDLCKKCLSFQCKILDLFGGILEVLILEVLSVKRLNEQSVIDMIHLNNYKNIYGLSANMLNETCIFVFVFLKKTT